MNYNHRSIKYPATKEVFGKRRSWTITDWLIVIAFPLLCALALGAAIFWLLLVPHEAQGDTVVDPIDPCAVVACPANAIVSTIPMIASWYDYDLKGYPDYSKTNATAASRDYPKGTHLLVCRADTGYADDCITVRVNDFGPDASIHPDRGLDLSSYAFQQIAPLESGLADVSVRAVK